MTTTEQSCEARIAAHQEGREADFARLFAIANGEQSECPACDGTGGGGRGPECEKCDGTGEIPATYDGDELDQDDAHDRIAEYPLWVSVKRVLRVDLSTGGPGDWIEAELDDDGDVVRVAYHFNDWFDHAERTVEQGSALWIAAENYAEYVRVDR